jgi:glycosyltransferase involved in cell wall biosynthesis
VLIDYRPALRERSGVGEYTHQLVAALAEVALPGQLDLTIFSSSWKDRLSLGGHELPGVTRIDRRVPVRLLNFAWHRLGWPPVETLAGATFDLTHSLHPLILPSRTAARVITIHDLNFLAHPDRTRAEIRRDYPALARSHARRADRILVPSRFTGREVERHLDVPADKISVCSPGAPPWPARQSSPAGGYVLFFGTLEPRKNVGTLLDAYESLIGRPGGTPRLDRLPDLVLAGKATMQSRAWLRRIARPPLSRFVRHVGYVDPANRRALYDGARLLVQPSFEEGFGLPVLEAMTVGVPVVAADRGSLPEVLGDAGLLVNPDDAGQMAGAIARMLGDAGLMASSISKGVAQARRFTWQATARHVYDAYLKAVESRRCGSA